MSTQVQTKGSSPQGNTKRVMKVKRTKMKRHLQNTKRLVLDLPAERWLVMLVISPAGRM